MVRAQLRALFGLPIPLLVAAAVHAADPPSCTDKHVLHKIKESYQVSLMVRKSTETFTIENPHEIGSGFPPRGVNQYAPETDYYNKSRYCEAVVATNDGTKDVAYYRLDGRKDASAKDYNLWFCSKRFDSFEDGCEAARLNKK